MMRRRADCDISNFLVVEYTYLPNIYIYTYIK